MKKLMSARAWRSKVLADFLWKDRRLRAETPEHVISFGCLNKLVPGLEPAQRFQLLVPPRKWKHPLPYPPFENIPFDQVIIILASGWLLLKCTRTLKKNERRMFLDVARLLRAFSDKAEAKLLCMESREWRKELTISATSLAQQVGVDESSIGAWEEGLRIPQRPLLYRWCQALGFVAAPKTALVRVINFSPELVRFLQEHPIRLRSLTPEQFERFTAERLDRMGFNVTLTGATNRKDGGIDLIAVPKLGGIGSIVIAGQVKHHRGDQRTDRLLAWKDSYFDIGLLVTNTSFTRDAIWTAQHERNRNFLRLRDFNDLKRWLQDQWGTAEGWREIPDRIELAPGVVVEIPKPKIITNFDLFERE